MTDYTVADAEHALGGAMRSRQAAIERHAAPFEIATWDRIVAGRRAKCSRHWSSWALQFTTAARIFDMTPAR